MPQQRPNILFIMTDDHAAHAMSCYGSRINTTPNLDRIATEGMRFDNCFCTNSICEPSRAAILTGTYNHINGVTTIGAHLDNTQENVAKLLQRDGYQTAIIGKWHLGEGPQHCPTGFDYWHVLPGQGLYHNPTMVEMGETKQHQGYVTDLITDFCIDWLDSRDQDKPFFLMCHHKAPHRSWEPDDKHKDMYKDIDLPVPDTFDDDYSTRCYAAREARMTISHDLWKRDIKCQAKDAHDAATPLQPPDDLANYSLTTADGEVVTFASQQELKHWKYQRYIKDYLRCIASVDDNVGRLLAHLETQGILDDTLIIYTSDQGFFLGDHGWFDKRFMYEESLRMPLLVRYPKEIKPGSVCTEIVTNIDFAPTWLDFADCDRPEFLQGYSTRSLLHGETPDGWQQSMYYRYWMHLAHHYVSAHYGVRTKRYKLIYYYGEALGQPYTVDEAKPKCWELFDLAKDPNELNNVYTDPAYAGVVAQLTTELERLQTQVRDTPQH